MILISADSLNFLFGEDAEIMRDTDFQLLLLTNVLGVMGPGIVSPLFDSLIGPFDTTVSNIGLMMSAFSAPAIVVILFAGTLADRYGRKPLMIGGLLLFGIGGTSIALTTDFRVVLGLRLVQGIGFAGLIPIVIASIGDLYDGAEEATAQGLRFATSGLSQMVFPILAGSLVVVAWQYPFLLYGLSLPAALIMYLWFEEPASTHDGRADTAGTEGGTLGELVHVATRRRVFAVLVARGIPNMVFIAFLTYNSIIVVQTLKGTPQQAGLLIAVFSLVFASVGSQTGRITAALNSRLYPLLAAHVFLAAGLALIGLASSYVMATISVILLGIGAGISAPMYRSVITGFVADDLRGGLVSVGESWGRATSTFTPIVMGVAIALATPAVGFVVAVRWTVLGVGAVSVVIGVVCLLVAAHSPPSPMERADSRTG